MVRVTWKLRGKLVYDSHPIHIMEDYTPEVVEQRAQYHDVMKMLYGLGLKPLFQYPAKFFIVAEDRSQPLSLCKGGKEISFLNVDFKILSKVCSSIYHRTGSDGFYAKPTILPQ